MRATNENRINQPFMVPVLDVKKENPYTTTIELDLAMDAEPGQFVMVWVPGVDEKPMSLRSYGDTIKITVESRGECTKKMTSVKKGELLGIRGPYGRPFTKEKNSILVGGGVGMPPMANLADAVDARLIQGARSKDRLLFTKDYPDMLISTDDGTQGHKGYVTELLEEEINRAKPPLVCACGPEMMMVAVRKICKDAGVKFEGSLERYMRCGIGVCGSCVCGKKVVCIDGPVFTGEEIDEIEDFGKHALSKSAKKLTLKEYYGGD